MVLQTAGYRVEDVTLHLCIEHSCRPAGLQVKQARCLVVRSGDATTPAPTEDRAGSRHPEVRLDIQIIYPVIHIRYPVDTDKEGGREKGRERERELGQDGDEMQFKDLFRILERTFTKNLFWECGHRSKEFLN
jgi:hypothetical protein